jgi:catechol-2,3-dioxygenase
MPSSCGLTHVAMSVPEGTLTDAYRERLLEFYGRILGWREMESLRLPGRLTVAVGSSSYINIRERPDSMVTHGYEHFGVLVRSAEDLQELWAALDNEEDNVELEPLSTNEAGEGSFRFRYLLPMAVEAQFYASL